VTSALSVVDDDDACTTCGNAVRPSVQPDRTTVPSASLVAVVRPERSPAASDGKCELLGRNGIPESVGESQPHGREERPRKRRGWRRIGRRELSRIAWKHGGDERQRCRARTQRERVLPRDRAEYPAGDRRDAVGPRRRQLGRGSGGSGPLDLVRRQIGRPFWIDTVGRSALLEIRIKLDNAVMRVFAPRRAAYVSNSHIFLLWMVGTSLVLITVAVLFLRNQIRPILRLADAAESFGKGREVPDFRPRGAREVRRAAQAFIEMKRRIERSLEQRTAMLAGVSHDLRTILTRFKLELVLIGDSPEVEAMKKDVDEMARMLEAYLAFARGDSGEQSAPTDMGAFLEELKTDTERNGHKSSVHFHGHPIVTVRPAAFKRCLANLVSNAARYAPSISITGHRDHRWLIVTVDDDGPGIAPHLREEVFKPFLRLDDARNQDEGGTGLGLAIARDIARSHGGDIILSDSPLGGLRATVRVPV
jgi:signal transduction histidine kinase